MGRIATRVLVDCVDDPTRPAKKIELPMALMARESTTSPVQSIFHQNRQSIP